MHVKQNPSNSVRTEMLPLHITACEIVASPTDIGLTFPPHGFLFAVVTEIYSRPCTWHLHVTETMAPLCIIRDDHYIRAAVHNTTYAITHASQEKKKLSFLIPTLDCVTEALTTLWYVKTKMMDILTSERRNNTWYFYLHHFISRIQMQYARIYIFCLSLMNDTIQPLKINYILFWPKLLRSLFAAGFAQRFNLLYSGSLFMRFRSYTQRHTTVGRVSLDEVPARHRDLYLTTHTKDSQQKNAHSPGGIWTHDPSRRTAVDLRPLGPAHVCICDTTLWAPLTSLANWSLGCKRKDKIRQTNGTLGDDVRDRKQVIFVDVLVGYRITHLLKEL